MMIYETLHIIKKSLSLKKCCKTTKTTEDKNIDITHKNKSDYLKVKTVFSTDAQNRRQTLDIYNHSLHTVLVDAHKGERTTYGRPW